MAFNQFLMNDKTLKAYPIHPFIDKHPLHITLYLSEYEPLRIPQLIQKVQKLAQTQKTISLTSGPFIAYDRGYVMLDMPANKALSKLSEKTMHSLMALRSIHTKIPSWAAHDKHRVALFNQYGSPNVLNFFHPHVSIFDERKYDARFNNTLKPLVHAFNQQHLTPINTTACAIGVGVANTEGQIIQELMAYPLNFLKPPPPNQGINQVLPNAPTPS